MWDYSDINLLPSGVLWSSCLILLWGSCDCEGVTPGVAIVERENKRTHSSSPISEHVIFTPFLQGRTVSRPVLTSVRARRDKVAAYGPARLHVESKANTYNPSDVNLSFIHRVSKTPQSLRTCPHASYAFPGIAKNLKDGWTENQRTRLPPCANALQCYKEVWWTEERESIPFHPQSAAVVLLNITTPPPHPLSALDLDTPHGWHLTSGWNLISCYFAQWLLVRDRHVDSSLLK